MSVFASRTSPSIRQRTFVVSRPPRASQATCCTRYGFGRGTAPDLRVHVETQGTAQRAHGAAEGEIGVGADAPRHVQAGGLGAGVRREPDDAPRQPLRVE